MSLLRPLGKTDLLVSPVAMGCWPIAGMTSLDVNDADSLATLHHARECGINFFDTAYCYGADGESERLLAQAFADDSDAVVIATKGGILWGPQGEQVFDARRETLLYQCERSLRRLRREVIDLYYLHAPDPRTPVTESAAAFCDLLDSGKIRAAGASNFTLEQLEAFHAICPLTAYQPPYNMLQRQIERDVVPWCMANDVSLAIYWPLMKGLLAGRLPRDYEFPPGDGRRKYPMFQGEEWQKNHDFLDRLRPIAEQTGRTLAQVVVNWTIHQPGITTALCGAKRPWQIEESAGGMGWELTAEQQAAIAAALEERGEPVVRLPV